MNKLVLLHESIRRETDIIDSIRNDCIIKHISHNTKKEEIRNSVNFTYLTNVAFVWHYPGHCQVPFFYKEEDYHKNESEEPHMIYFSKDMVTFMKSLPNGCKVDLLSCNLEDEHFKNEVETLERECGVDIRYSVDQTGNNPNGNWILESDNVNVKDIYFTEAITAWNGVLNSSRSIEVMATNASTYFDYEATTKTLKLTQNCSWNDIVNEYYDMSLTDYIHLDSDEIFDGQGFTIDLGTLTNWNGLFACSVTNATSTNHSRIVNLGILNGTTSANGGFFVREMQQFFSISNCYSTGKIYGNSSGGIVGRYTGYAGNVTIQDCYSIGQIYGSYSGGIAGRTLGYFGNVTIRNCYSIGQIYGSYSGGIAAANAGEKGNVTIQDCYSTGEINGFGSGGIAGSDAGYDDGNVTIQDCYSTGEISGNDSGGISGKLAGNKGNATIQDCYSTGEISGDDSGGIIGKRGGEYGNLRVQNCYSTGRINGISSGGIAGKSLGMRAQSCIVKNCYSTGRINGVSSGGIAGHNAAYLGICTIQYCYSTGEISGSQSGGIAGQYAYGNATIQDCYSTGEISGSQSGGIAGTDSSSVIINCYSTRISVVIQDGTNLLPSPSDTTEIQNMLNSLNDSSDTDVFILETSIFEYPILSFQFVIIEGCTNILASNYNAEAVVDDGSCIVTGEFIITDIPNDLLLSNKNELLDSALNDTSFNNNLENLLSNQPNIVEQIFQEEMKIIPGSVSNDTDKKETIKYIVNKQRELNKPTNDTEKLKKYFDIKTDISSTFIGTLENTLETSKKSLMSNLINNFKNILPNHLKNIKTQITDINLIASITTAFNNISVDNKKVFLQIVTNDKSQLELNDGDLLIAEFGEDVNVSLAVNGSKVKIRKSTDTDGNDVIVYGGLEYTVGDIIRVSGGKDILIAGIGSGAFELVERTQAVIYSKNQSATINSLLTLLANAETVGAIVDASLNVLKQE
jgi:hypothetical protein